MSAEASGRILCVDDDTNLLDGLRRGLGLDYDVSTASSGPAGLDLIRADGPFAVVISDMRMPEMDGATFLAAVRKLDPLPVRILLTGQADLPSAIAAINRGQIFRFLTKPCAPAELTSTIDAALEQHRLITAEKVLLEQTLQGSIKTLLEVLALASPEAFSRATRVKALVTELLDRIDVQNRWAIEVATMLCQVPCITLPPDTIERLYTGTPLARAEQVMVDRLPTVAENLFSNIPRLEPVLEILRAVRHQLTGDDRAASEAGRTIPIGARIVRIAQDYDTLHKRGLRPDAALEKMRREPSPYDPLLLRVFAETQAEAGAHDNAGTRQLVLRDIRPGMVFLEDVKTRDGMLVVASGSEVTAPLLQRLANFASRAGLREPLVVRHDSAPRTQPRAKLLVQ